MPLIAAFADRLYVEQLGCQTRALFAYDERLRLLPFYLQQLEMESNGKSVTTDGEPVDQPTAPVTWGGTGTDAQHAVFQLLHQGTVLTPEILAAMNPYRTGHLSRFGAYELRDRAVEPIDYDIRFAVKPKARVQV